MLEFEEIYNTYFNDVFRYIRKLSNSEHIAEEITADTFFKAMHAIDSFRGDCDVRVWLCQIAKNCWYSRLRKDGRLHFTPDELPTEPIPGPAEQVVNAETARRIQTIFESLPEPQHGVFSLRVFGQLSFKQIAAVYGKTENWACVTYHRARGKIREQLEDEHE